jgi:hypothetical protein
LNGDMFGAATIQQFKQHLLLQTWFMTRAQTNSLCSALSRSIALSARHLIFLALDST